MRGGMRGGERRKERRDERRDERRLHLIMLGGMTAVWHLITFCTIIPPCVDVCGRRYALGAQSVDKRCNCVNMPTRHTYTYIPSTFMNTFLGDFKASFFFRLYPQKHVSIFKYIYMHFSYGLGVVEQALRTEKLNKSKFQSF